MSEEGTLRLLETPLIPTHHPLWTDPLWQMLQDFALTHHKHAEQLFLPPKLLGSRISDHPPCIYSLLLFKFLLLLLNLSLFCHLTYVSFLFCLLFFFLNGEPRDAYLILLSLHCSTTALKSFWIFNLEIVTACSVSCSQLLLVCVCSQTAVKLIIAQCEVVLYAVLPKYCFFMCFCNCSCSGKKSN